jgi:hypothetical protein
MARHSRIRRSAKWGGTLAFALIVIAYLTGAYEVRWISQDGARRVSVRSGSIDYGWMHPAFAQFESPENRGFCIRPWLFRPAWWPPVRVYSAWDCFSVYVQLWLPLVCAGVLTAVLWWLDRRRIPPGHCRKCGYDLTGNVSGRCPECGTEVRPPPSGGTAHG